MDQLRYCYRNLRAKARLVKRTGISVLLESQPHWGQFGEDVVLKGLFGKRKKGFYVDVGAHDPTRLSNTLQFYQSGWSGLNIEPLPNYFERLQKFRDRDTNLKCAVSSEEGEVSFVVDQAYSGIDSDQFPSEYRRNKRRKIQVKTRPLLSIFEEHLPTDQQIDFMSVDCEGHDLEVLKTNDWDRFRPLVLIIECHDDGEIKGFVLSQGYRYHMSVDLSSFFIREDRTVESLSEGVS